MTSANNQSTTPDAGNSLGEAQDLGLFSYSITDPLTIPILTKFSESVGGDDSDDYFQFSLDNTAGVSVSWSTPRSSSETITVELLDSNGTLIKSLSGTNSYIDGILFENLNAGTYYLHLLTGNSTFTNYNVQLLVGLKDNVDSVSQTPKDLGVLTATPVTQSDYVYYYIGISDSDTYSFTLTEASTVDFTWTDGVGDNTSIDLGSDFSTLRNDRSQETVSYQKILAPGTYEFTISGSGSYDYIKNADAPASYNLTLTASEPPDAGNSLEEAQNLGLLSRGIFDTPGYAGSVQVVGNYAYIADGDSGLQIIDISDSKNPTLVGSYDDDLYANEAEIDGNYAYVANGVDHIRGNNLQIIDITNPDNPVLTADHNPTLMSEINFLSKPFRSKYVYVNSNISRFVEIIDISDPENPISDYGLPFPASTSYDLLVDSFIYLGTSKGLEVYDTPPYESPFGLDINYYVGNLTYSLPIGFSPDMRGIYKVDNYIYLVGNFQFEFDNFRNYHPGLAILEVNITRPNNSSDPYNFTSTLKGTYILPSDAHSLQVIDNIAYIANGTSGLQLIDVSDPMNPQLQASYDTWGTAVDVWVENDYAYVADGDRGLKIIDLSINAGAEIPIITELQEFVGGDDSDDYYQFSLDKTAGVSVAWSSSESITVELLDSNKTLIKSLSGTNIYDDDVLFDNLKAGTYYLHLLTGNNTVSNYDVELFVGPTDNVDNASQTPKDLGDLTATSVTQSDYIYTYSGFSDSDTYSFTLTEASVVDFTWTDGVGDNTNIYLGSGFGTFEDLLPYYNGDYEETVSYQRTLGAGTYEFTIDYKYISNAPASYNLTLTASEAPDAGNSLGEAQDLGLFSYSITSPLTIPIFKEFSEVVGGDDSDDYFKFTLDNTVGVSASWSSSETITVEILDSNGTFIKSLSSNHNDVLFENLNAGTYYLHLLTGNNTVSAYDLVLQVGPTDNVDNASQTPKDLGDLTTTPFNQSDYVHGNRIQDHDIYSLTLTEETVVDFTWTDGVGDDTRFQLWSISPVFATFNYLYNWEDEETVSYQETLGPGTYRFEMWGSGPVYAPASYDLTLTATPTGNTNDSPTDITLSNTTIDENEPINTEIGTLTTTDTDAEETFTYSLVAGE